MKNKKSNSKKVLILLSMIFIVLSISQSVLAIPNLPTEIYGRVRTFNQYALEGTEIKVYDSSGTLCGITSVTVPGFFGTLTCSGKDTDGAGTGPVNGEKLSFRVDSYVATALYGNTTDTIFDMTFEPGEFKYTTLVVPPIVCGDNFCDNLESCSSCPTDCGACPGGSTSPVGESGGSSGASTESGTGNPPSSLQYITDEGGSISCEESWDCTEWGPCLQNNTRERSCIDLNSCGSTDFLPDLVEPCIYYTPPDEPEENLTIPIPEVKQPRAEIPGVISTCEERMNVFSIPSLLFLALYLIILAVSLGKLHREIRKIRKDEKLDDIKKLEKEYKLKKETYIFVIIITIMAIIVYLYHYFFFMCIDKYVQHLWLLGLFIIISPVIINIIIELMKFTETEKLAKLKMLKDTHYQHFLKLLEVTNKQLAASEKSIMNHLEALDNSEEFHAILTNFVELKPIYKDMNKLHMIYLENQGDEKLEKELLKSIKELENDEKFREVKELHPELGSLLTELDELYKAYGAKEELYEVLEKIKQEYLDELVELTNSNKSNNEKKNYEVSELSKETNKDDSTPEETEKETLK